MNHYTSQVTDLSYLRNRKAKILDFILNLYFFKGHKSLINIKYDSIWIKLVDDILDLDQIAHFKGWDYISELKQKLEVEKEVNVDPISDRHTHSKSQRNYLIQV